MNSHELSEIRNSGYQKFIYVFIYSIYSTVSLADCCQLPISMNSICHIIKYNKVTVKYGEYCKETLQREQITTLK